jgi:hypothetical protein
MSLLFYRLFWKTYRQGSLLNTTSNYGVTWVMVLEWVQLIFRLELISKQKEFTSRGNMIFQNCL